MTSYSIVSVNKNMLEEDDFKDVLFRAFKDLKMGDTKDIYCGSTYLCTLSKDEDKS